MSTHDLWSVVGFLREQILSDPQFAHLARPVRVAHAFRNVLERLPIGICTAETLAGDMGWDWGSAEDLADLDAQMTRWSESHRPSGPTPDKTPADLLAEKFHCFGAYTLAHTCVDYERVVKDGISGFLAAIRRERVGAEEEKATYLEAMEIALTAVVTLAGRFADLADNQAASEKDSGIRDRLRGIAAACRHVPFHPARNFHEALQAVWLVHITVGISELCDASLSLGRLDQYLYPLFKQDLDRGVPLSQLKQYLTDLHRKLNRFGDPACAVNLGGVDKDGQDLFNPLSRLIVEVAKELQLPSPILAARIHKGIPADVFDLLVDPKLFAIGQPTFYGEFACRNALIRRGVPETEVHRWAANSCMGLVMPGQEISDMWGSVVNFLLPLELAVNVGRPFHHHLPIALKTPAKTTYGNFDELFETVVAYTNEILDFCIRQNRHATLYAGTENPNPFFSALIDDGIATGKDRCLGGARYHTVIVEAFGLINVADALFAVKRLVFEQKQYTLAELVQAARENFQNSPAVQKALLEMPKFGNNDSPVDELAGKLAERFAQSVAGYSDQSVRYAPSFHTLNAHIGAGMKFGASLDGRLAGQPLAKNIGPIPGRNRKGHTALMLSATSVDQSAFYGGQALDISLTPDALKTSADCRAFQSLLQTYFRLGGLQVQVNGVNADVLRQAIAAPQDHQNIIVRIAGYSARFVTLDRPVQEEMVERFAQGL